MILDRREVMRYLRMGNAPEDAEFSAQLDAVAAKVMAVMRPRAHWLRQPIVRNADGTYAVGPLTLNSVKLAKALEGFDEAFLFIATLGSEVDALTRRLSVISAAEHLIADAVANSLIETWSDECCARIAAENHVRLGFRFAPGYGDLPLDVQRPLLTALDSARSAGVSLGASLMMNPLKSISAIIGAADL